MIVALAASLLALLATADAQKCRTVSIGKLNPVNSPMSHSLPDQSLKAGHRDLHVDIPEDGVCGSPGSVGSYHGGTTMTACDDDVEPDVLLTHVKHADVHREGSVTTDGLLSIIVHCKVPGYD